MGFWQGAVLTWDEAHVEGNQALTSVDGGAWPVGLGQPFPQSTDWVSEYELEKWICAEERCLPTWVTKILLLRVVFHLTDHPIPLTRVGNQPLLGCEKALRVTPGEWMLSAGSRSRTSLAEAPGSRLGPCFPTWFLSKSSIACVTPSR